MVTSGFYDSLNHDRRYALYSSEVSLTVLSRMAYSSMLAPG